jgi:chromate transporter
MRAVPPAPSRSPLREVALLFLKLGVIGFGGPAAHVAMMRDEVVRRRGWIDDAEFLELVGATNLIPGPNSTELAIHLGHRRAGVRGLFVAGAGFIGPAVAVVSVLAWLYAEHGTDPAVVDVRYGVLPVIVAVVAHALAGLARTACRRAFPALLAAAALVAYLAHVHELLVLVVAGAAAAAWQERRRAGGRLAMLALAPVRPFDVAPGRLFLVFLEIGSVLYGSGYVLLAFLQRNLVDERGWLTTQQLLDAVAVGQFTPGPVFTTATFVGWQIDGPLGAAVATAGIFAPAFAFVALLSRIVAWMRARPAAKAFLDGVTAASLGLMAGVLVDLAGTALADALTVAVAAAALVVLARTTCNSAWLVGAGVLVGAIHGLAG